MPKKLQLQKYKLYFRILWNAFVRKKIDRTQSRVESEYDNYWNQRFGLKDVTYKSRMILDSGGKVKIASNIEIRRTMIKKFNSILCSSRPQSVLEMGTGTGMNILSLAVLHPEVERWVGLDLTKTGIKAAESLLASPPLEKLSYITGLDQEIIKERLLKASIKFIQGSMLNLPIEDESFDLVFSSIAIEQIPNDYLKAFQEAYRATSKWAFFYEGFNECQNLIQWLYRWRAGFMRASYSDLQKVGFQILYFEPHIISKIKYVDGLAFCKK